jgi:uncharacterized membrane protein
MNINTTRVETLSDGVIAIVITIMVLEFKLPSVNNQATSTSITNHLLHLLPYFGVYLFSFMMIGILWTHHHHMFHLLDKIDNTVLWQNFTFLFFLSFIPFSTGLLGANLKIPASVAFYGFILLLTTLSFTVMRSYTLSQGFVHKDKEKRFTDEVYKISKRAKYKGYIACVAYLIAIPLAFVSVYISYLFFLVPPVLFFLPDGIDDERLAEKIIEKNR